MKLHGTFTWNFHLCPNGEISQDSLSCPVVYKAWKGMWKEWEFCTCPLIDNGNIQLDMGNYVNGTFCMDHGNMLHGSFLKGEFQKMNNSFHELIHPTRSHFPLTRWDVEVVVTGIEL